MKASRQGKCAVLLACAMLLGFAAPARAVIYEIGFSVQNSGGGLVVIPVYFYNTYTGVLVASARSNHSNTDGYNFQIDLDGQQAADTVGHVNLNWDTDYTVVFGNGYGSAVLHCGTQNQIDNDDWFRIRPQPTAIVHTMGNGPHYFTGWPTATYAPIVVISGPTSLGFKVKGTFTANVTNGGPPVTYEWRYRLNGVGAWSSVVGTAQVYERTMANIDFELQATCARSGLSGVDTHYVHYFNGPIDPAARDVLSAIGVRPNPTRGATEFSFDLRQAGHVAVTVFDSRGRRVGSLFDGDLPAGPHRFVWNAAGMRAGLYLVHARGAGFEKTAKLAVSD